MKTILTILFFISIISVSNSADKEISKTSYKPGSDVVRDFEETFYLLLRGGRDQFLTPTNIPYLGAGIASSWYAFEHDDRIISVISRRDRRIWHRVASGTSVVINFPVLPIASYYLGRYWNNSKLIQFSMEYMATLYLTLAETVVMSYVDVHERPDKVNLSFWETAFRGESSYPSGHIVPFSVLTFKVFQFYGPLWALIPGTLAYFTAYERIQGKKHYTSDILGGIFLSAMASEGVRVANKYKQNHPIYKWIFEHEVKVGLLKYKGAIGPRFTLSY